jgi:hypothetical protein
VIVLLGLCGVGVVVGAILLVSDRSASAQPLHEHGPVPHRADPNRSRRVERLSKVSAALALVWTVGAVLALFFVPMVRSETSSSSNTAGSDVVTVTRDSRPPIDASGPVKVAATVVAGLVLAAGWRAGRPPRTVLLVLGWSTMVFVIVTGFSIGLFFLPVPVLLLSAAALARGSAAP